MFLSFAEDSTTLG